MPQPLGHHAGNAIGPDLNNRIGIPIFIVEDKHDTDSLFARLALQREGADGAHYAGIPFESVIVNTSAEPETLIQVNPLGKIPTLVTDDGKAVFDSRAITQYLNRVSRQQCFSTQCRKSAPMRNAMKQSPMGFATFCWPMSMNGGCARKRKIHQPWLDLQWRKAERTLDLLNEAPPRLAGKLHAGHLAVAAALGYLALRFEGKWERNRSEVETLDEALSGIAPGAGRASAARLIEAAHYRMPEILCRQQKTGQLPVRFSVSNYAIIRTCSRCRRGYPAVQLVA